MIRYALPLETDLVIALFNSCFPGEEAFATWFFANIYRPEKTILYVEGNVLAGALQMLDVVLTDGIQEKKACYIYGVGTLPQYRGKGIANQLLEFSFAENRKNRLDYSILITQNDSLFDFYKRFGYEEYFYTNKGTVQKADFGLKIHPISLEDLPSINLIYEQSTMGKFHAVRTSEHYKKMLDIFSISCTIRDEQDNIKAYAFGYIEENQVILTESIGDDIGSFAAQLAYQYGAEHCIYMTSVPTGEKSRLGMIKPILSQFTGDGYLNLLYN